MNDLGHIIGNIAGHAVLAFIKGAGFAIGLIYGAQLMWGS